MAETNDIINSENKSLLRFTPLTSFVNSSFWFKFVDLKLNQDMLNEVTRHIWGYYSQEDRTGSLLVDCTSFNREFDDCSSRLLAHGFHCNMNTIERFKNCNKSELLRKYGEQLSESIKSKEILEDPSKLVLFILLTFADLKKYTFTYWFAFPAVLDYLYYIQDGSKNLESILSPEQIRNLFKLHKELPENQKGFFCFELKDSKITLITIKNFVINHTKIMSEDIYICFLDPTVLEDIPGWPLRNLLSLLKIHCDKIFDRPLKVVSIRGKFYNGVSRSFVFTIQLSEKSLNINDDNKIIGWEKNSKGKLSPRVVNLTDDMDPTKLSSRAVDLNLKLVKWRLQPDLDLLVMKNTSCLLLGAGTLGCSVARVLLAWGIEKITFVDNGIVSYSNPVRQSLYVFSDGKKSIFKAEAAASALQLIHPGVVHSRESRWLPTLMCSTLNKIAITIALGYDSYVVIRHGIPSEKFDNKLGCYFCNDIVVPGNSQVDRTLDQQCTVTRPGISGIAASFGVELLISLLQHPDKGAARSNEISCLGKIPHSIRGFISDYEHMFPSTQAFDQCIACSPTVINEYLRDGDNFLSKVFSDTKYLENVTSLSQYQLINDELEFPELSDEEN
ncbi:hypothetical protein PGB90_007925 [Kerria lacca]